MSGENIVVYGTTKTLEVSGATITNNSIVQADDATYDVSADGAGFPDALFVAALTFSVAPTENTIVSVYARPLDIDGTLDTDAPEATRPTRFIGSFVVNNVTTQQLHEFLAQDLPRKAEYYLHNNATGQSVSSGWTLKVTPRTYKAAP